MTVVAPMVLASSSSTCCARPSGIAPLVQLHGLGDDDRPLAVDADAATLVHHVARHHRYPGQLGDERTDACVQRVLLDATPGVEHPVNGASDPSASSTTNVGPLSRSHPSSSAASTRSTPDDDLRLARDRPSDGSTSSETGSNSATALAVASQASERRPGRAVAT